MKRFVFLTTLLMGTLSYSMGDTQPEKITSQENQNKKSAVLVSDKLQNPYNPKLTKVLLKKFKTKKALTEAEQAHFEILYQKHYVGEEEMTPLEQKVIPYFDKAMDQSIRQAIETRSKSYEMVGPDKE